jgi:hypothetical protein
MDSIKLANDMVHCSAIVNTGGSTMKRKLSNYEAALRFDKSVKYRRQNGGN